jgi:hypothetical protein
VKVHSPFESSKLSMLEQMKLKERRDIKSSATASRDPQSAFVGSLIDDLILADSISGGHAPSQFLLGCLLMDTRARYDLAEIWLEKAAKEYRGPASAFTSPIYDSVVVKAWERLADVMRRTERHEKAQECILKALDAGGRHPVLLDLCTGIFAQKWK